MEYTFIAAQIIGIILFIVNVIGDFQNKKKRILLYNGIVNFLCAVQYFLLGAYTGIICCLVALIRNIVFSKYRKVPTLIFLIYLTIAIIVNIPFIHSWLDIIPLFNIIIFSYALKQNKVYKIKKTLIITGTLGILYDITERAYTGVLLNVSDLLGGIYGIIKFRRKRKK